MCLYFLVLSTISVLFSLLLLFFSWVRSSTFCPPFFMRKKERKINCMKQVTVAGNEVRFPTSLFMALPYYSLLSNFWKKNRLLLLTPLKKKDHHSQKDHGQNTKKDLVWMCPVYSRAESCHFYGLGITKQMWVFMGFFFLKYQWFPTIMAGVCVRVCVDVRMCICGFRVSLPSY